MLVKVFRFSGIFERPRNSFESYSEVSQATGKILANFCYQLMSSRLSLCKEGNKMYCYIARLSLNKTSAVLVDAWSSAPNHIQMYPDRDTVAQLFPARRLLLYD